MYMTQDAIANDAAMRGRVAQCAAQNGVMSDAGLDADLWSYEWRREWASAPGWSDAWESALAGDPPNLSPGSDPGVITDGQIESQVQAMMPFLRVGQQV